jgi:hypothetical protein
VIIGLSGYAKAGKDTAADTMIQLFGFERASFAAVLRDCMAALNPIVAPACYDGEADVLRYNEVLDYMGYTDAKEEYPEVRELLQRMGTEVGRNILGENVWVDAAMSKLDSRFDYVFTDVRFPNEYDAVKNAGGVMVRITRPGITAVNAHPSETSLDDHDFDYYIENDKAIPDLNGKVWSLMTVLGWGAGNDI